MILAVSLMSGAAAYATANDLRSVGSMQNHYRVLIAFAPSLSDARLRAQRSVMARIALEAARRDILLVQVDPVHVIGAHDDGHGLRRRFHVPVTAYRTILLDRDGHVLRDTDRPINGATILHAIDAARLRQDELQPARSGKAVVDKS